LSWLDLLWAFAAITLISFTYIALPGRYHMKSEWQEAAFIVMMTSVFNRNRWQERLLAKLRVLDIIGNLICHSENKPKDSALDRRPFL
jgi:hypothetical protein